MNWLYVDVFEWRIRYLLDRWVVLLLVLYLILMKNLLTLYFCILILLPTIRGERRNLPIRMVISDMRIVRSENTYLETNNLSLLHEKLKGKKHIDD